MQAYILSIPKKEECKCKIGKISSHLFYFIALSIYLCIFWLFWPADMRIPS